MIANTYSGNDKLLTSFTHVCSCTSHSAAAVENAQQELKNVKQKKIEKERADADMSLVSCLGLVLERGPPAGNPHVLFTHVSRKLCEPKT